jgi:hypothetical protein
VLASLLDSPLEGNGFEISVPGQIGSGFEASVELGTVGAALSSEPSSALGKPIELLGGSRSRYSPPNEGADAVGEWRGIAELKFRIHSPPAGSLMRTIST